MAILDLNIQDDIDPSVIFQGNTLFAEGSALEDHYVTIGNTELVVDDTPTSASPCSKNCRLNL